MAERVGFEPTVPLGITGFHGQGHEGDDSDRAGQEPDRDDRPADGEGRLGVDGRRQRAFGCGTGVVRSARRGQTGLQPYVRARHGFGRRRGADPHCGQEGDVLRQAGRKPPLGRGAARRECRRGVEHGQPVERLRVQWRRQLRFQTRLHHAGPFGPQRGLGPEARLPLDGDGRPAAQARLQREAYGSGTDAGALLRYGGGEYRCPRPGARLRGGCDVCIDESACLQVRLRGGEVPRRGDLPAEHHQEHFDGDPAVRR